MFIAQNPKELYAPGERDVERQTLLPLPHFIQGCRIHNPNGRFFESPLANLLLVTSSPRLNERAWRERADMNRPEGRPHIKKSIWGQVFTYCLESQTRRIRQPTARHVSQPNNGLLLASLVSDL
jgi:hypothetical protein